MPLHIRMEPILACYLVLDVRRLLKPTQKFGDSRYPRTDRSNATWENQANGGITPRWLQVETNSSYVKGHHMSATCHRGSNKRFPVCSPLLDEGRSRSRGCSSGNTNLIRLFSFPLLGILLTNAPKKRPRVKIESYP